MSLQYQYIHQQSRTSSDFSDTLSRENGSHIQELNMIPPYPNGRTPSSVDVEIVAADDMFRDDSPSRDSGFSDNALVEKFQLDKQSVVLVKELKTVARLTDDFRRDVSSERESCRDLLAELERKIRPFLIKLDEQIGQQEDLIKRNLDKCRITDTRVTWLLHYNHFMLDFRRIVEDLTCGVYDELERILRLKTRGCDGIEFKSNLQDKLNSVFHGLDKLETSVRLEVAKTETSYEQDNSSRRSY